MKALSLFLILFSLVFFTACEGPGLGGKIEKTYFTGGKVKSEFIMTDSTGQNGQLKKYGYEGHLTSVVNIQNGVKNGMEVMYDSRGRVISKTPYVNGRKHGTKKDFYPNGDIMGTIPYQYGMKEGTAFAYNKDGTVYKKVIFQRDRLSN
jgi:antitoxin component YwqK of YwqJK toxin-antitoxin module